MSTDPILTLGLALQKPVQLALQQWNSRIADNVAITPSPSPSIYSLIITFFFNFLLLHLFSPTLLSLESEASSNLMGSLVQVLRVKRCTKTQGNSRTKEDIVSQSGNATVVDLGLQTS